MSDPNTSAVVRTDGSAVQIAGEQPGATTLSLSDVTGQVQLIQRVMRDVMKDGEHYGVIPGTNKPSLLKPGAEKLCTIFGLSKQFEFVERKDLH